LFTKEPWRATSVDCFSFFLFFQKGVPKGDGAQLASVDCFFFFFFFQKKGIQKGDGAQQRQDAGRGSACC